jgi:hypothetical protein
MELPKIHGSTALGTLVVVVVILVVYHFIWGRKGAR